ncbi:MAG: endonuclease NucS [candidate division NC10 bacterium]|nr:endonuclease NucS [candidate division NC10 bacterium]
MLCKLCGTQLPAGQLTCPECGHVTKPGREKGKDAGRTVASPRELGDLDAERAEGPEEGVALEEKVDRPMAVQTSSEEPLPVFALDAAGLRRLLARQPELLEAGLSVFTDEKGKPVGTGYSTQVGEIDLLALDKSGAFVVVRVADREGGGEDLVAETLQRIGWVRKHLGKGKQKARGIILVEQAPENLSYTAAGVAGTITFKTYRVAVTFEDVVI